MLSCPAGTSALLLGPGLVLLLAVIGHASSSYPAEKGSPVYCPDYLLGYQDVPCWTLGPTCYCFSLSKVPNWSGADQTCRSGNMTLVSIESPEENDLINDHVKARLYLDGKDYWTSGQYSQLGASRWEWTSTLPFLPFNYTNWHLGNNQPDDSSPGSCALLYYSDSSGYWADNNCAYAFHYICKLGL